MKAMQTHKEIQQMVEVLYKSNMVNYSPTHALEDLEDLIADLIHYRDTLPTTEEYSKAGKL